MITGNIIKQAKQNIKQTKDWAENIASARLSFLLENENFRNLYKQKKQAEIENAKCQASEQQEPYDVEKINKNIEKFYAENNLPKNYLTPPYTCKKCNDTGSINNQMCDCLKKEVNKLMLEASGIKHTLCTFETANPTENNKLIHQKMKDWCNKKSKIKNIVFLGNTGTGKTYLMECMADNLIKNGNVVCWTSAFKLNQDLLAFHTAQEKDKHQILLPYLTSDCLFVDDLGTEPMLKNVTAEGIYLILSERMENDLPTVISTNLDLAELEDTYGERIFSRLLIKQKSLTLKIENEDLRIKRK